MDQIKQEKNTSLLESQPSRLREVDAVHSAYYAAKGMTFFSICASSRKLEDNDKAIEACKASCALREDLYKETVHSDMANSYSDLGAVHNLRSELVDGQEKKVQLDLALSFFTKAMKILNSISKSGMSIKMPTVLQNIATVFQNKEQYKKAVEYLTQALKIEKKLKVDGFYSTATMMLNLANTYRDLGKQKKALKMAQEAVVIRFGLLGDHPKTVHALYAVAVIEHELGNYVDAIKMYQKAFEMEEHLPFNHHSMVRKDIRSSMILAYNNAIAKKLTYLGEERSTWELKFKKMVSNVSLLISIVEFLKYVLGAIIIIMFL